MYYGKRALPLVGETKGCWWRSKKYECRGQDPWRRRDDVAGNREPNSTVSVFVGQTWGEGHRMSTLLGREEVAGGSVWEQDVDRKPLGASVRDCLLEESQIRVRGSLKSYAERF